MAQLTSWNHVCPLQWEMAGLGEYFARGTDDILPDELLERVTEEVLLFEKKAKEETEKQAKGGRYMHGKMGTFWRPLFDSQGEFLKPRFAIEAAIQLMYKADIGEYQHERVSGAEWWVQRRQVTEDINFHHDKDEAMASLKATMKFPEVRCRFHAFSRSSFVGGRSRFSARVSEVDARGLASRMVCLVI